MISEKKNTSSIKSILNNTTKSIDINLDKILLFNSNINYNEFIEKDLTIDVANKLGFIRASNDHIKFEQLFTVNSSSKN